MAEIGVVGVGVMGANLALNMAENGHGVAVTDRDAGKVKDLVGRAGDLAKKLEGTFTQQEFVAAIQAPRPVLLLVPAGAPVDAAANALLPLLSPGDIIIDAGNSNFHDTRRRSQTYAAKGIDFIGIGVSGGEEGARHGPSIMSGGLPESWARISPVMNDIAAKFEGEPCAARVGPEGAGHFVKTVHNGIEYADMELIAEIYGILRDGLGMSAAEMAETFAAWNGGRLKSYLIEITATVLDTHDPGTGKPIVDLILDTAGQKGTGRWAAMEAEDLGVPATVIEAAVAARVISSEREQRLAAEKIFGPAQRRIDIGDRNAFIDDLERALLAGKIVAYAEGFDVMGKASDTFKWNTPLGTVAKIWRAGCIIRSVFLDDIAKAYAAGPVTDLVLAPFFAEIMKESHNSLRRTVSAAVLAGIPVPALSAALARFDLGRTARTTANLIQGQRDFFGAHGFERTDQEGTGLHGPWSRS
jgi:6-phosphogluconate dehydrogenase